MNIWYATRDGQSKKIAEQVAHHLVNRGIPTVALDLMERNDPAAGVEPGGPVVAILALRYGHHLPEGIRFLKALANTPDAPPLFLASVNLTARKAGKDGADSNVYLRKLIAHLGLKPVLATAFAGRLDYPRYKPFDRFMIRLIMRMTGGPTDPSTIVEYTDWAKVEAFAAAIAAFRPDGEHASADGGNSSPAAGG
ncbi:protoporphyrinogen oxidase [Consotaella salsifontis]|uniref:Protoporphyrinogen oxidase n=2 Tax=Consotaella salsifontis TaxID=1365950 RepID=A0A1T4MUV7_9HYPH|nr:protoporphyrinogen oxidase [Consotaella salsifontis]